jgi:hypothetical protein
MNNKKLKSELGDLVGGVFLISAIYFIWANTGFTSLFKILHLSFLFFGYLISRFFLGWILFLLIKIIEKPFDYFDRKFPYYLHRGNNVAWIKLLGFISQILIFVSIFFITKHFYVNFFTAEYEIKHPPLMRTFYCEQFKPNGFTLGKYSNPTNEQIEILCTCLAQNVNETDRKILTTKFNDEDSERIKESLQKFSFAIKKCGGEDL